MLKDKGILELSMLQKSYRKAVPVQNLFWLETLIMIIWPPSLTMSLVIVLQARKLCGWVIEVILQIY